MRAINLILLYLLFQSVVALSAAKSMSIPLYDVVNVSKYEYGACNKNYGIASDDKGRIFLANDMGLVVYDGLKWNLYPHPRKFALTQIYISKKGTVYSSSASEMGVWYINPRGQYSYRQLTTPFIDHREVEICNICESKSGAIYFNRAGKVYSITNSVVEDTQINMDLSLLYEDHGTITDLDNGQLSYFQETKEEVDKLLGHVDGVEVKKIIKLNKDNFLYLTLKNRLYLHCNKTSLELWNTMLAHKLGNCKINKIQRYNNQLIFSTQNRGLYIYDLFTDRHIEINKMNYLNSNRITDFVVDQHGRILVSTMLGVSFIEPNYSKQTYYLHSSIGNEIYTIAKMNDCLLIGTERGLFSIHQNDLSKSKMIKRYKVLPIPFGRVWSLTRTDEGIVCGHSKGTYLINKCFEVVKISGYKNGQSFQPIRFNGVTGRFWIQNASDAIVLYKEPFDQNKPIKYSQINNPGQSLAVYDEYLWTIKSGEHDIYRIPIEYPRKGPIKEQLFLRNNGIYAERTEVLDGDLAFFTEKGIFRYDTLKDTIREATFAKKPLGQYFNSSKTFRVSPFTYWFLHGNDIALFKKNDEQVNQLSHYAFDDHQHSLVDEFEYIFPLNSSQSIVCIQNGFTIVNHDETLHNNALKLWIGELEVYSSDHKLDLYNANDIPSNIVLTSPVKKLSFSIGSEQLPKKRLVTKYRINKRDSIWTEFDHTRPLTFCELKPGSYALQIRSWNELGVEEGNLTLPFKVNQKWYEYINSFVIGSILFFITIFLIVVHYIGKYNRRKIRILTLKNQQIKQREHRKKLEVEKKVVEFRNQNLRSELDAKSRQLILFAMDKDQTSRILNDIKLRFASLKQDLKYRLPDKYYDAHVAYLDELIDKYSDTEELRKFIDQQHKDFIKELLFRCPSLTDKELRTAILIKMDFSNQKIAELFQVSVRSIEIYRYNIRKKMSLDHAVNLKDHLIELFNTMQIQ
ncbi:LuxR C-terminal-related transcriptional regulator [Halosquirtibacter xylanolyticus]|uniref:LuxR C-terminal-related transcriptional regulator n=1 Tax=Halosquirtibacter xylanolyticus TaxID=3374599 RepID=UPI00374935A1|nr:LuxR C-terminal-related transcriptional regulator [Prolixibacteraceae bacterium]